MLRSLLIQEQTLQRQESILRVTLAEQFRGNLLLFTVFYLNIYILLPSVSFSKLDADTNSDDGRQISNGLVYNIITFIIWYRCRLSCEMCFVFAVFWCSLALFDLALYLPPGELILIPSVVFLLSFDSSQTAPTLLWDAQTFDIQGDTQWRKLP